LNLTHETREGILKHCSKKRAATIGDLGERFINNTQPTLEAQLVDLADSIAYNNHDLDDGLRSGLIKTNDLEESPFFYKIFSQAEQKNRQQDRMVAIYQSVRKIIDLMVTDLIDASRNGIKASKVETVEDIRGLKQPLITFSDALFKDHNQLKTVLREKLYSHPKVEAMYQQGETYVSTIFNRLMENPEEMPERHRLICKKQEEANQKAGRAETVADYIAGMTDRYAISEYSRLS
jgi:dGTPase